MTENLDVHRAARDGDIDSVRTYLESGGDPRQKDRYECEAFYYAVKHDNLEIARLLLVAGGDIHHHSGFRGDPIGAAVWNLNQRMIEFLLSSGVNINRVQHGKTPLDLIDDLNEICREESSEMANVERLLLQHSAKRAGDIV